MIMYSARQVFAFGILSTFLLFVLFYGFADSLSQMVSLEGSSRSWGMFDSIEIQKTKISYPELSQYKPLRKLTPIEFPIDDPTKRVLVVGDIHGMMPYLEKLLKKAKYTPSQDILIHVGDIVTKGPLKNSLAVLEFMASNNVTGVRGNHDQLVIEWRNWYTWVSSCPDGKLWLEHLQARWEKARSNDPEIDLEAWVRKQKKASTRKDKTWWKLIPKGWIILDDHYHIAKEMSNLHFQYLLDLPLRLYIPSAHAFIVHAGLLPCDPRYPVDDKTRQPLARIPTPTRQPADNQTSANATFSNDSDANATTLISDKNIDLLRNLQETGILTQIPQNLDPWVVQNMRSILSDGKVSKQPGEGMPWSKLWKQHMESCLGFKPSSNARQDGDDLDTSTNATVPDDADSLGIKKLNLKCYPSTIIYGHAAARGLDIKRWSFGLDTGCVYKRKLSALVIKGQPKRATNNDSTQDDNESVDGTTDQEEESDEDDDDISASKNSWLPFGDAHRAKVIAVRCKP